MTEDSSGNFAKLVEAMRAGDAVAASEFVKCYEPHLRRIIRVRLSSQLRTQMDSTDITQSVFADLFSAFSNGELRLESPGQVLRLLERMAYNKFFGKHQKATAAKRDVRRETHIDDSLNSSPLPASGETPSLAISNRELVALAQQKLTESEKEFLQKRLQGAEWSEIGEAYHISADAARNRFQRIISRLRKDLNGAAMDGD